MKTKRRSIIAFIITALLAFTSNASWFGHFYDDPIKSIERAYDLLLEVTEPEQHEAIKKKRENDLKEITELQAKYGSGFKEEKISNKFSEIINSIGESFNEKLEPILNTFITDQETIDCYDPKINETLSKYNLIVCKLYKEFFEYQRSAKTQEDQARIKKNLSGILMGRCEESDEHYKELFQDGKYSLEELFPLLLSKQSTLFLDINMGFNQYYYGLCICSANTIPLWFALKYPSVWEQIEDVRYELNIKDYHDLFDRRDLGNFLRFGDELFDTGFQGSSYYPGGKSMYNSREVLRKITIDPEMVLLLMQRQMEDKKRPTNIDLRDPKNAPTLAEEYLLSLRAWSFEG